MSKLILNRLKSMIGESFLYKGNEIIICNYHVMDQEGIVQVDVEGKPPIKVKDVQAFMDACLPIDEPVDEDTAVSTQVVHSTNNLISTLQQTLLDNIQQVKKDKDFIKQANVINSSVNALIGMAKLQIQVGKMSSGKK